MISLIVSYNSSKPCDPYTNMLLFNHSCNFLLIIICSVFCTSIFHICTSALYKVIARFQIVLKKDC